MDNFPEIHKPEPRPTPKMKVENNTLSKQSHPEQEGSWLESLGKAFGVNDQDAVATLLSQFTTANCKFEPKNVKTINALIGNLAEINPADPAEAMLAVQMITAHRKSMELMERVTNSSLSVDTDAVDKSLKLSERLMRTYVQQMEALARYRRKGEQKVRVERVTVNEGGRAIVGNMDRGSRE